MQLHESVKDANAASTTLDGSSARRRVGQTAGLKCMSPTDEARFR